MSINYVKATINGQTYELQLNSSTGKYEGVFTAPASSSYNQSGHYYPVSVEARDRGHNSTTIDDTDSTFGSKLQLVVKEKTPPVITITAPTADALIVNNRPAITWTVTDDDSGVDSSSIGITIDSGSKITEGITKKEISNGYECAYTPTAPLVDGSHTIKVDASDNDGNAAVQKSVTFKVDTVPPTLSVDQPYDRLTTSTDWVVVRGTTNDVTSSPVTLTVNGTEYSVNDDGTFNLNVNNLKEGSNVITIVATDSAGQKTTVTRTVIRDTIPPVIKSVTVTPNPVDAGKTYTITVEVTD